MADEPKIDVAGLQLSNNSFSASPPGSLATADNCVMPQKGVIESRRGQDRAFVPPAAGEIPFAQTEFKGSLIINSATNRASSAFTLGVAANPTIDYAGGPWNPVDTTSDVGGPSMKFGFAGSYLYFCTTTGPKCLETTAGPPRAAGLSRMPDPGVRMLSLTTQPKGWLPYRSSVAYRTLLRLPTSDGTSPLSPPSGRAIVTNRILAPIGGLSRTVGSGTTVTATIPGQGPLTLGLAVGDTFTLTPGESNFPAGTYTVASVTPPNVFTYTDAHAPVNATSTVAEDFDTGPRAVHITVNLPDDATTDTPWRAYRSLATSSSTVEPGDEMFLVNEAFPTSGQISAGLVGYDDATPESVISNPLYTNPQTGEGANQANNKPPLYRDVSSWGQREWYAQTTGLQTFDLEMLGVGTPDGVQANDTITLSVPGASGTPYVFTFKAAPSSAGEVRLISDDLASVNILRTSQNFVAEFNSVMVSNSVPVRAYYNSAQDEAPGKILVQRTGYIQEVVTSDGKFSFIASRPASWTPALDTSTAVWSTQEYQPNGLAYSKLSQPEAVPPVNFTNIGSKNYPIARILGLQNALLVFKQGDGIYSVTGSYPFQVLQIATANIIAPDACAVHADDAWVYTDQGFLRITDSGGSTVVSRPIETELNALRAVLPTETALYSFVVSYETERRLLLFVPFSGVGNVAPPTLKLKAWCYNSATGGWTGPLDYGQPFSGTVGLIANRLTLGTYDATWATGRVTEERKSDSYLDYADAAISKTISAVDVGDNPLVVQLSSAADVAVGDGIIQGQWATKIRLLRTDLGTGYVELYEDVPFTAGSCHLYKHFDVAFSFLPTGHPSTRKVLTRLQYLFKPEEFANYAGNATVLTDQVQANDEIPTTFKGFGLTPFGQGPFGNPSPMSVDVNPIGHAWTTAAQFFVGFELSEVWAKLKCQGHGLYVENATGPAGRGR